MELFQRILEYCGYREVEALRNCCKHLHDYTKSLRDTWILTGMRPSYYPKMIYSFVKWSKTPNNLPSLSIGIPLIDDEGNPICILFMEGRCANNYCQKSHKSPKFNLTVIANAKDSFLDLDSFYSAVTFVFSPAFLWRQEVYIKALFEFYCNVKQMAHRTVRNSIDELYRMLQCIYIYYYALLLILFYQFLMLLYQFTVRIAYVCLC